MPNRFSILPFSFDCQPSAGQAVATAPPSSDVIPVVDDPGELEPDEEGDAAFDDDEGSSEAPTRAALMRSRARAAARAGEKAEPSERRATEAALAVGLGQWAQPRRKKLRAAWEVPTWASLAARADDLDCPCKCEKKFERLGKAELLHEIRRRKASSVSEAALRSNFTRAGLLALLCGAICEPAAEDGAGGAASRAAARQTIEKPGAKRAGRQA